MKKSVLLFIISVLLFVCSCKKAEDDTIANFRAVKDGKEWVATSDWTYFSKKNNVFSINAAKRDPKYYQEEVLHLSFLVSDISETNSISKFSANWTFVIGGDAVSNRYNKEESPDNQIQIGSIDTINRIISGTFSVKLKRDNFYGVVPEFFDFTSGQFSLNYRDVQK